MDTKEQKAKEYSKEYEEYNWRLISVAAFETGWDEALESQWVKVEERKPNKDEYVFALVKGEEECCLVPLITIYNGESFSITSKYFKVIAWMPIPSFDKILEDNKDILKRLKDKHE